MKQLSNVRYKVFCFNSVKKLVAYRIAYTFLGAKHKLKTPWKCMAVSIYTIYSTLKKLQKNFHVEEFVLIIPTK